MFMEFFTVVVLLALGAFGWWFFRSRAALARKREEEHARDWPSRSRARPRDGKVTIRSAEMGRSMVS